MEKQKIRVLVVEDSLLMQTVISSGLSSDPRIEVVGISSDPFHARDQILECEPDVITLDIHMPRMDGIEFLKKLIPQHPLPVVVVSSQNMSVFDALGAGAVDFVKKPGSDNFLSRQAFLQELIAKVKVAAVANVGAANKAVAPVKQTAISRTKMMNSVIAIGASTGGTEAIATILKDIKQEMPGMLIVQHMPPVFTRMYAERLNSLCRMEVKEAENNDKVCPGRVLIAPGEYHMALSVQNGDYTVKIFQGEKVNSHRPSVDVLFHSVAQACPRNALGIILTGMGHDGAAGLRAMRENGAYTIGQDETSSVVYGMPMVAYTIGAVAKQLPLDRIAHKMTDWVTDANSQ